MPLAAAEFQAVGCNVSVNSVEFRTEGQTYLTDYSLVHTQPSALADGFAAVVGLAGL